jgi:hypothetical protein
MDEPSGSAVPWTRMALSVILFALLFWLILVFT